MKMPLLISQYNPKLKEINYVLDVYIENSNEKLNEKNINVYLY